MKMNKILAAGVAATLAVTSLATVAGATERTFNMQYSKGTITYKASPNRTIGVSLDNTFGYDNPDPAVASTGYYAPTQVAKGGKDVTCDGIEDFNDWDAFIPVNVTGANMAKLNDLTVLVKGRKMDNGNLVAIEQKAKLTRASIVNAAGTEVANAVLPIYFEVAPTGCFLANDLVAVDSIEVVATSADDETRTYLDSTSYTAELNKKGWGASGNTATVAIATGYTAAYQIVAGTTVAPKTVAKLKKPSETEKIPEIDISTATQIAAATAPAGDLFAKIVDLIGTTGITWNWTVDSGKIDNYNAWMPGTTAAGQTIVYRNDVKRLSTTLAYGSQNIDGDANPNDFNAGLGQTYDEVEYNKGKLPQGFSGLASQVADFFNKQLNGTITFHFAAGKTDATTEWANGGIPSTEVGIKNAVGNLTNNDMALFVNYGSTTGSLQAVTEVKAETLEVTFDISDILDALNGQTIGTVQDIYYGLVTDKTPKYDDGNGGIKRGFSIDTVTLAYDEDAAADDTDVEDADDAEEADDADDAEEADDAALDVEDDGDTAIDDAPEADDTADVGGEVVVVVPDDDDANPGTGVALAVIPALIAGAAVVVSKKRK